MGYVKEKKYQTCLSAGKVMPTDGYLTQPLAIIYIPARMCVHLSLLHPGSYSHMQAIGYGFQAV